MNLSLELLRAEAAVTGFRRDMLEKVAHPPGQAVGQHRAGAVLTREIPLRAPHRAHTIRMA